MGSYLWPLNIQRKLLSQTLKYFLSLSKNLHYFLSCASNLYLNITSNSAEAKQVLFSLPVLPAIFCIYLYILSIERLGLCGVGGLPTPSFYIPHPPTVGHIYLYPYITISLYPYSIPYLPTGLSHITVSQ